MVQPSQACGLCAACGGQWCKVLKAGAGMTVQGSIAKCRGASVMWHQPAWAEQVLALVVWCSAGGISLKLETRGVSMSTPSAAAKGIGTAPPGLTQLGALLCAGLHSPDAPGCTAWVEDLPLDGEASQPPTRSQGARPCAHTWLGVQGLPTCPRLRKPSWPRHKKGGPRCTSMPPCSAL